MLVVYTLAKIISHNKRKSHLKHDVIYFSLKHISHYSITSNKDDRIELIFLLQYVTYLGPTKQNSATFM